MNRKTRKIEDLQSILDAHARWLHGKDGGKCADLEYADLRGAVLSGANLDGARMSGCDLSGANLSGAIISEATLSRAVLVGANLDGCDLSDANLRNSDLRGVILRGAFLHGAILEMAVLANADLRDADVTSANFHGACLCGAVLDGARVDYTTIGLHPAPEGELRAWGKKGGKIVEMIVPKDARRSCATTRKFRAEYVDVVSVEGGGEAIVSNKYGITVYRAGERVRCHEWCEDRWQECGGGIHFFLTRAEAEEWDLCAF